MSKRRVAVGAGIGALALAVVAGASVLWPGLDARDTPPVDTAVWALQTSDGRHYARVNTAVGELDTIRNVANPSTMLQHNGDAFLFTDSYSRVTKVDAAAPINVDEDAAREAPSTPQGTAEAVASGDYVVYRTDAGSVYAGVLSTGSSAKVDPYAKIEDGPDYVANSVAVTPDGIVYAYSSGDKQVLTYSITEGKILGTDDASAGEKPLITGVDDTWFLFNSEESQLYRRGGEAPIELETTGNVVLASSMGPTDATYLADEGGLIRIPLNDDEPERIVGTTDSVAGTPVRPSAFEGTVYAAWLGSESGTLWRSGRGEMALDFGDKQLDDSRRGVFVASGSTMILNETRKGWVWTMPDGVLLPSSQNWTMDDEQQQASEPSDEQAEVVLEPKPPIAEADSFGVRAGSVVSLPVLLNDHDPNVDVLSIDPSTVSSIPPEFGALGVTDNGGRLSVAVDPGASGTVSFDYAVSDGTTSGGLMSNTAKVTLTVIPATQNQAPKWCGVEKCLATWPEPEVRPGGTVTTSVLNGWVDPDGDPMLVLSATVPDGQGVAAVTSRGEVVYQHQDPSDTTVRSVPVTVTVADAHGLTATRSLKITVTPTPKLAATSFATVVALGTPIQVDVSSHVTGAAGNVELKNVELVDGAAAEATRLSGTTRFDFSAKAPGTYRVQYVVTDGTTETEALARITLLPADAAAQLATAPVVAFVRPQEDATIDVLAAVSNPTSRVLMVTDVTRRADPGATLQINTVGSNFIRATGSTIDGEPGRLGVVDYTVTDGTTDSGSSIAGQLTIYLLPPVNDIAPIATDDAVVVRAGTAIDVPVLDNDVAPSGASLMLDPSAVVSSDENALAFASGSQLRYLAPEKPGDYTVDYAVYAAGSPALQSRATVKVTVIGADAANRAPRPKVLAGRVLSGQSTRIAFDTFGADPDGDEVVLDRIVDQPKQGSASITSDGDAIIYVSKPGAPGGQDTFTYRVTDPSGESRTGTVRVGVLDAKTNPAPITFTDYVQVSVSQKEKARVLPLDNDIDPTNGKLELVNVVPSVAETLAEGEPNEEFVKWKGLLSEIEDNAITIAADSEPGTMSFLYDVVSSSGNTARGLIVVKIVRETVPDYPVVADTVLTAETRDDFASGVDVIGGKVSWTGGNVSTLTVSPWEKSKGVKVSGYKVSGQLTNKAATIPFAVSGALSDGKPLTTYAFVRIPAADDASITLRSGLPAVQVKEKESVDFDMRDRVVMPPDAKLEVNTTIATTGARAQASCTPNGSSKVTYTAGEGAPWTDACVVPVRIDGQDEWTYLSVPVLVTAIDPVPVLNPASTVVMPGDTVTFDLRNMVTWQGREDWNRLNLSVSSGGGGISVSKDGFTVTLTAEDSASPGTEVPFTVTATSHPNVAGSQLMARVGPAPSELPRAGSTQKLCTAAGATSCAITVLGIPGQQNPFRTQALTLESVDAQSACTGVSFAKSGDQVVASWGADAPGGTCTVGFTMKDAQGRITGGEGRGTILFDLHGYPRAPASISQAGYADGTLTLQVTPGAAQASYPELRGFRVVAEDGSPVNCGVDGRCEPFPSPNGTKRTFTAYAVNAVGESQVSVTGVAWSYAPPDAPASVTSVPVPTPDQRGGVVDLTISGIDAAETDRLLVTAPGASPQEFTVGSSETTKVVRYAVKSNTSVIVSVTPVTRWPIPPIGSGNSEQAGGVTSGPANGVGLPTALDFTTEQENTAFDRANITVSASAVSGGDGSETLYGFGMSDTCDGSQGGPTRRFSDIRSNTRYTLTACAYSVVDGVVFGTAQVSKQIAVYGRGDAPTGFTFRVNRDPDVVGRRAEWRITSDPEGPSLPGYTPVFAPSSWNTMGSDPGITVRWKSNELGNEGEEAAVTPARGSAPYQVSARWVASCVRNEKPTLSVETASGGIDPEVTIQPLLAHYYDKNDRYLLPTIEGKAPATAVRMVGLPLTISWGGTGLNLGNADSTIGADCTGDLPPDPTEEPTDDPTDDPTEPAP